jgi:cardiolipin synthase A/B
MAARLPLLLGLLTLGLFAPGAAAQILMAGFAPDLPGSDGDDAILLASTVDRPIDLTNFTLTDGEGTLRFPAGSVLAPQARIVIAVNGTSYAEAAAGLAHYAVEPAGGEARMQATGSFLLSRVGDQILLMRDDTEIDAVAYGSAVTQGIGWIGAPIMLQGSPHLRWYLRAFDDSQGWHDRDSAVDWERPKPAFVGMVTRPLAPPSTPSWVQAYTAPEASRAVLRSTLMGAQSELRLNVYELRDLQITQDLLDLAARGVRIKVLVDEAPVGLTKEERRIVDGLLQRLTQNGIEVRESVHERIGYNHAKYVVIDSTRALVQTENLVPSGIPRDAQRGNRGWGLVVEDAALATQLATVFDSDFRNETYTSRAFAPRGATQPPLPEAAASATTRAAPMFRSPAAARLVLAPDHLLGPDDPVLALIQSARESVRIVQLNAPLDWKDGGGRSWPALYLDAVLAAAQRGVRVQVLLDGHFVDDDPKTLDNADTVSFLNNRQLPNLNARLVRDPQGVLHAKGVVVDERAVLVGSLNWNLHSPARNREVNLIVENPETARFFAAVFDADWAQAGDDAWISAPGLIGTILSVGLLIAARRRGRQDSWSVHSR